MIVPMLMVVVAMRGTVKALCGTYGVGLTQVMLVVVSKVAVAYYSSLTKRKVLPISSSPKRRINRESITNEFVLKEGETRVCGSFRLDKGHQSGLDN